MTIGYDSPLYVLPFDHRATFAKHMFGWHEPLSPEQTAEIAAVKQVIYDGFKAAVASGVPKDRAGILVDEQFGAAILRDASKQGFITACPAEKSGQGEFDFEFGPDFARHIEAFNPTFCKVLVRYNPEGDGELNRRQAARLKQLSDYLHQCCRLYMFELLVPPEPDQLRRLGNDRKAYDLRLRPALMVQAMRELQDAGVEADVWKIEGIERTEDCQKVVAVARRAGRDQVGCILLGRGEDENKVRQWLTADRQRIVQSRSAVNRQRIIYLNGGPDRHSSRTLCRFRTPCPTHAGWSVSPSPGCRWSSATRDSAEKPGSLDVAPVAAGRPASGGIRQPAHPVCREKRSGPTPIATMRCRFTAVESETMRCRKKANDALSVRS